MKLIIKNQSSDCRNAIRNFIWNCQKQEPPVQAHYDAFREKDLLRQSLLQEQGYICAYCMQRVVDSASKTKIEHWKTRESYNQEKDYEGTLNYDNLLAVCDGEISKKMTRELNCDSNRAKKNPILTVNPIDPNVISQIKYSKNGKILSDNKAIEKDLNEHLNLNLLILQDNRMKILNDIHKIIDIRCRHKSFEQNEKLKKAIIQNFVSKDKHGYFKEYIGVITFFYKKYL